MVPDATKLTLEPTVAPLDGLFTVTPAKADAAKKRTRIAVESRTSFFICRVLSGWICLQACEALDLQWDPPIGQKPGVELGRHTRVNGREAELAERSAHSIQESLESQRENAVLNDLQCRKD